MHTVVGFTVASILMSILISPHMLLLFCAFVAYVLLGLKSAPVDLLGSPLLNSGAFDHR